MTKLLHLICYRKSLCHSHQLCLRTLSSSVFLRCTWLCGISVNFFLQDFAYFSRTFEAIWILECFPPAPAYEHRVHQSWETLHCSLHPPKAKGVRASPCDAKELITRDFQSKFKARIGIRAFYPEPQLGGNSNTGNVARRFFQSAAISADILGIPEDLISTFWELLVAINSTNFQDIQKYETKAKEAFNFWRQVFPKVMTANCHLLIVHGSLYLRWAQEEIGVPLGTLTEGSIEVTNKDVKIANRKFVTRVSAERIHRDIMTRRSWECDPLLHYEMTQNQVTSAVALTYY